MAKLSANDEVYQKVLGMVGSSSLATDIVDIYTAASLEVLLEKRKLYIPFIGNIHLALTKRKSVLQAAPIARLKFIPVKYNIGEAFLRLGFKPTAGLHRFITESFLNKVSNVYKMFFDSVPKESQDLLVAHDLLLSKCKEKSDDPEFSLKNVDRDTLLEVFRFASENNMMTAFRALEATVSYYQLRKTIYFHIREPEVVTEEKYAEYLDSIIKSNPNSRLRGKHDKV